MLGSDFFWSLMLDSDLIINTILFFLALLKYCGSLQYFGDIYDNESLTRILILLKNLVSHIILLFFLNKHIYHLNFYAQKECVNIPDFLCMYNRLCKILKLN